MLQCHPFFLTSFLTGHFCRGNVHTPVDAVKRIKKPPVGKTQSPKKKKKNIFLKYLSIISQAAGGLVPPNLWLMNLSLLTLKPPLLPANPLSTGVGITGSLLTEKALFKFWYLGQKFQRWWTMELLVNVRKWVEENKTAFLPPVCNKLIWRHWNTRRKVAVLRSPNRTVPEQRDTSKASPSIKCDVCWRAKWKEGLSYWRRRRGSIHLFYYPVEVSVKTSSFSNASTDGNSELLPLCTFSSCLQKCQHNLFYEYS